MKGIFIGQHNSMGLVHGNEYSFKYIETSWLTAILRRYKIVITVRKGPFEFVTIPYSRPLTFLKNWQVTHVDDDRVV